MSMSVILSTYTNKKAQKVISIMVGIPTMAKALSIIAVIIVGLWLAAWIGSMVVGALWWGGLAFIMICSLYWALKKAREYRA